MRRLKLSRWQVLTHVGAWVPLAVLLWDYFNNNLTVNPIQEMTLRTGKTTLVLLLLSLSCSPLNALFGWREAVRLRRPLGLYTFLYASVHFMIFLWLDYGFDWTLIYDAIFEKRYAIVGFMAFLILLPLAVTSTQGWQRRLGRNWKRLHRTVYVAAGLAIVHYVWLVKSDVRQPLAFGAIVAVLLVVRIPLVKRLLRRLGHLLAPAPARPARRPERKPARAGGYPADGQD